MKKILIIIGIMLLGWILGGCGTIAFGESLPDKPVPVIHVYDESREFKIEAAALTTAWLLDTISTAQRFNWCNKGNGFVYAEQTIGATYTVSDWYQPRCSESGGLFDGTRDTAKIMGAWAAVDVGAIGASYLWKRYVHNRWVHWAWRVPLLIGTAGHTRAATGNWAH